MTAFTRNGVKHAHIRYFGLFILFCLLFSSLPAQEYAFIYIDGGTGTNTSVGTTWTNVGAGGATDFTSGVISDNWNHTTANVLTASNATAAGYYSIKYSLSFGAAAGDWSVGVSINGDNPVEPIFIRTISNSNKDAGNVSGILMASISSGQTFQLVVKSDIVAGGEFTPGYAQLAICPAAQNPTNSYAGMNIDVALTLNGVTSTYEKMTGFSAVPEINNWTYGTSDLTANSGAPGIYYMSFSVSLASSSADGNPDEYTVELVNASGSTNIVANRSTSVTDIGNMSAGGLVSVSENDKFWMQIKTDGRTKNVSIEKATLSMFKLGDNTPNAVAAMDITEDKTVTISGVDTWTTVGTYSPVDANMWDFSSNVFTLNDVNAYGYYFLEYSISLMTTYDGGSDVIDLGIFISNTLKAELSTKRTLSSDTDVGAVCGVGLFSVDGPETVTLKVKNTSASNLTIKKSMVGFSQIRYVSSETALPISLNSFNVEQQNNVVKLNWQTASEVENLGYKVYRKENDGIFEEISSYAYNDALRGQGTTTDMHDYEFTDTNVEPAKEYTYLLSDISYHMEEIKHIDYLRTIYLPEGIQVDAAYPNPFNPLCTIPYTIDVNEHVRIDLLNISGKIIRTLVSKDHIPGNYNVHINEPSLGSGVYLVRVQSGAQVEVQKIMMLK
jgi:hypothetical protein